ncbi:hypothetical protein [Massilia sp. NP310]|uniref:portal protein n=1 Tax=Massilia sp. NP310 TaxID=2861282 RepID=UPI001C6306EA|nr:hypothetical protein [Massilia sp. NP310]QYG03883.1 hypothetical protein KY496_11135 [Massilia sp. NP310]
MAKIAAETFDKLLDHEIEQATTWQNHAINPERERNYALYLGLPDGKEVEGRSQVVSWDVFEVVESALPSLLDVFLSGDNVGEFEPVGPEDEEFSGQATDYINHIVKKQNPGFLIFNTWFKDALLAKVGVVRAFWNDADKVTREKYKGLDQMQLTLLMQQEGIEVIEHQVYADPDDVAQRAQLEAGLMAMAPEAAAQAQAQLAQPPRMLYDVDLKVTRKKGQVQIRNVRPETFLVSRRACSIYESPLVGQYAVLRRSDLVEMGIPKADAFAVQSYDMNAHVDGAESMKSLADDETEILDDHQAFDKAMEEVTLFEGYIQCDHDGDGIVEWRYVLRGANMTLKNEEADGHDYCLITPIPIPHRVHGLALADVTAPIQATNTALTRQYLDSLYLANNPRTYVNVDAGVNLGDLLDNRIGGIVRGKRPMMEAVSPLVTNVVAAPALQGIEFMDTRREIRTGITRYNQGLEADSLNKTATGVSKIMTASQQRMQMIARIMAETGVKDLFKLLLKLVCKHQDKAATVRMRGNWVTFDPRTWSDEMDATVNVGLGTGDKAETVMNLQMVINEQKQLAQTGSPMFDPMKLYNAYRALLKAMNIKGIDQFFNDPSKTPPPPPAPPAPMPEQILADAQVKAEEIKLQGQREKIAADKEMRQLDLQIKGIELQIKERELALKEAVAQREQDRKDIEAANRQPPAPAAPGAFHE